MNTWLRRTIEELSVNAGRCAKDNDKDSRKLHKTSENVETVKSSA